MTHELDPKERRMRTRYPAMSGHMVEFIFTGLPAYQLKAKDISATGIGVIVRPDSKFLTLIEVGQEVNIRLITPRESRHKPGRYNARVSHITSLDEGKFKGHRLVALELIVETSGH